MQKQTFRNFDEILLNCLALLNSFSEAHEKTKNEKMFQKTWNGFTFSKYSELTSKIFDACWKDIQKGQRNVSINSTVKNIQIEINTCTKVLQKTIEATEEFYFISESIGDEFFMTKITLSKLSDMLKSLRNSLKSNASGGRCVQALFEIEFILWICDYFQSEIYEKWKNIIYRGRVFGTKHWNIFWGSSNWTVATPDTTSGNQIEKDEVPPILVDTTTGKLQKKKGT